MIAWILDRNKNNIKWLSWGQEPVQYILGKSHSPIYLFKPVPYGLYWNNSNYFTKEIQITDRHGFRFKGIDIQHEKSLGTIRILVYGGSTTFSNFNYEDSLSTWPYLLESKFKSSNSPRVEVINAGLNYATSAELLSHFIFIGHTFKPDLLIIENPGNDASPIAQGDDTLDYSKTRQAFRWRARKFEKILLTNSALIRILYNFWLRDAELVEFKSGKNDSRYIRNQRLISAEPKAFKNNIQTFLDLALQKKIKVILLDFHLNEKKLSELKPGLSEGLIQNNKKMSAILSELANNYARNTIYIPMTIIENLVFSDHCHLTLEGEKIKSDFLYEKISKYIAEEF